MRTIQIFVVDLWRYQKYFNFAVHQLAFRLDRCQLFPSMRHQIFPRHPFACTKLSKSNFNALGSGRIDWRIRGGGSQRWIVNCEFFYCFSFRWKLAELWWWMKRACENEIRRWEQLSEAVSSCPLSNSFHLNEVIVIGRAGFGYGCDCGRHTT